MKRVIRYFAANGLLAIVIYFGMYKGNEGALNIAIAYGWLICVTTTIIFLMVCNNEIAIVMANNLGARMIPFWFDAIFDITIALLFAYKGYIWLGGFYYLHIILIYSTRSKLEKVKKWIDRKRDLSAIGDLPPLCINCHEYHTEVESCIR